MMKPPALSFLHVITLWAALLSVCLLSTPAARADSLDRARIEELASMLPVSPRGVGRPIGDRDAWTAIAESPKFAQVVPYAEKLLDTPIPELTDDSFLDFSRTGNRSRCQRVLSQRHSRVSALVLAECIENRGRFLPAVEEAIRAVSSEKTWVMPAHDRSLKNFRGETNEIDLAVAAVSWNLATADYWLADKLSSQTRSLIRTELERRTFTPFVGMVTEGKPRLWWLTGTNNWNAVCLAGVTGAALTTIDDRDRRAFFIAAAERYIQNFLKGFTPDGYCSEGIGYWNYGFGNYVSLAETVYQSTGGRVDMFDADKVRQIARFGQRMEIVPGTYPAFADCGVGSRPDGTLTAFLSRRFGWGLDDVEAAGLLLAHGPSSYLFELGLLGFANSATARAAADSDDSPAPIRDWFPDAGILICRPAEGNPDGLGAALKGGHNAEHHNHNDVGSYVVAVAGKTPLVDPGSEVYTARTFSSKRYDSGVLNSFGHPVPVVAGQLQQKGSAAAAEIVTTDFTDRADTLVLDLTAAYKVPGLKQLKRTFTFARTGAGSLIVTDSVQLETPQTFGTALVTFSKWRKLSPDLIIVGSGQESVTVKIEAGPHEFVIDAEKIEEDLSGSKIPTRIGINLTDPVTEATITLSIAPAAD